MKTIRICLLILIVWPIKSPAQSLSPFVTSPSGGFYSNSSGMLSYTIGEMSAVITYSASGKMLTQGFQQTWDISTAITEHPLIHFSFGIYPNPAQRFFNLVTKTNIHGPFTVIVLDMLGREMLKKKYFQHTDMHVEPFELSGIADGMYLIELKINENSTNTQNTFFKKIQVIQ
ncbi:MAG: T9SS type A sorting domain-containing protein [Saprospiraceae bacterium]